MALAFRNKTTADSTLTGTKPAGTADNDILVAFFIGWDDVARTITPPSGWTQRNRGDFTAGGGAQQTLAVFTKVASSEPASWLWAQSGAAYSGIVVMAYSGGSTSTPYDTSSTNSGTSTSATALGVTTAIDGEVIIVAMMDDIQTFGAISGMANEVSVALDSSPFIASDQTISPAGATGNKTSTITSDDWSALLIAIRPALTPTINTQPQNTTAQEGATATFTVSATTSGGTLHYQWFKNGIAVGTDSSSYTTPTLKRGDNGATISVNVTDDNGTISSSTVTLTAINTCTLAWI